MLILSFRLEKTNPDTVEKPIRFLVRAILQQPKLIPRDRVNAIIALYVTSIESRLDGPIPDKTYRRP